MPVKKTRVKTKNYILYLDDKIEISYDFGLHITLSVFNKMLFIKDKSITLSVCDVVVYPVRMRCANRQARIERVSRTPLEKYGYSYLEVIRTD